MCLVLYGSETGNCADLADLVFDRLRRRHLTVVLKPLGEATLEEVVSHEHVFVLCSTTGQGSLPANTQPLWSQILRRSLGSTALKGTKLYSFGLGSSAYPKFNWAIRKIHARCLQLGATEAVQRGEADDAGREPFESVFDQWLSLALGALDTDLQIIDAQDPSTLLPALAPIELCGASSSATPTPQRSSVLMPATVKSNTRITATEHFQDVRHISLNVTLSEAYEPGDVVSFYPANDDRVVDAVIEAQEWSAIADQNVVPPAHFTPQGGWTTPLTFRNLLKWHVDLNGIPRRKFFALAQHFCAEERQAERMQQFCVELDDLFDYTTRPRRSLAEVILEFDSLRIPTAYLLDMLPPLRPRQFSIASPPSTSQIDVAAAIVKYRTKLRRVRRGVCTHWLQQLEPNAQVFVSLERNHMRIAERLRDRPAIFVATGTGIAPIRSVLLSLGPQESKPYLCFGSRYSTQDFLFGDELQRLATLVCAFSREGGGYVQDQLAKVAPELPVEDAFIFVCGSSGPMPNAVREALHTALQARGFSASQAQELLLRKEKTGQYMQETW